MANELIDFLEKGKIVLEYTIKNIRSLSSVDENFYSRINNVWEKEIKPAFEEIKEKINNIDTEELKEVGLTGEQLKLKLMLFEDEYKEFQKLKKVQDRYMEGVRAGSDLKESIRKLLKIIDIGIDSLKIVVISAGAIKGLKDAILYYI